MMLLKMNKMTKINNDITQNEQNDENQLNNYPHILCGDNYFYGKRLIFSIFLSFFAIF